MNTVEPDWSNAERAGAALVIAVFCLLALTAWPGWPAIGTFIASRTDASTLSLLVPALVVVAGWMVAHRLSFSREVAAKRRETRIEVLESAFMSLHQVIGRAPKPVQNRAIEIAVGRMQLYGTMAQLNLLNSFVEEMKKPGNPVNLAPLLVEFQNSIRAELGLAPVGYTSVAWLTLYDADNPGPDAAVPCAASMRRIVKRPLTQYRRN